VESKIASRFGNSMGAVDAILESPALDDPTSLLKVGDLSPESLMSNFKSMVADKALEQLGQAVAKWAVKSVPFVGPILKVGGIVTNLVSQAPHIKASLAELVTGVHAAVAGGDGAEEQVAGAVHRGLYNGSYLALTVLANFLEVGGLRRTIADGMRGLDGLVDKAIDKALAALASKFRPQIVNGKGRPDLLGPVEGADYKGDLHHLWVELKPTSGDPQFHIASIEGKLKWHTARAEYKELDKWVKKLADYLRVNPQNGASGAPPLRGTDGKKNIKNQAADEQRRILANLRRSVETILGQYKTQIAAIAKDPTSTKNDDVVKIVDGALRQRLNANGVILKGEVSLRTFLDEQRASILPTLEFSLTGLMPTIALNIQAALAAGKPQILHREADKDKKKANRAAALKGLGAAGSAGGIKLSWDEYPFASSKEGGTGARVVAVPGDEQNEQGGAVGGFYSHNHINDGDPFRVRVIP
jgi:hypothetical protein